MNNKNPLALSLSSLAIFIASVFLFTYNIKPVLAATTVNIFSAKYTSSTTVTIIFDNSVAQGNLTATSTAKWHVNNGQTITDATITKASAPSSTMTLTFSGTPFSNTATSTAAKGGLYVDGGNDALNWGAGFGSSQTATSTIILAANSIAISDGQLPTLSAVSITSNNTNTSIAKVGNTVTISFTSNEPLNVNSVSVTSTSGSTINWKERQPAGDANKNWNYVASDADGSNLIAGVYGGRLYTSSDYGATWTERQPAGNADGYWSSVASDADGSNLIANAWPGRVYTSSDYGATWTERQPAGAADKNWLTVASDSDGSNLIVGMLSGRLYTSSDYGEHWTERTPTGVAENKSWAVASDADGSNLIAGVNGGRLYTSSDSGVSWTESRPAGDANKNWNRVASDADGSNLIAGVNGGRLYTSSDSGVSWTERQPAGDADKIWGTVSSNADGSNLVGGVYGGRLYASVNSGVTWTEQQPAGDADKNWRTANFNANGSRLIVAHSGVSTGRLYTSSYTNVLGTVATSTTDGGTTWTATYTANASDVQGAIGFDILFSDASGNPGEGVFASTNSTSVTFDGPLAPTNLVATGLGLSNIGLSWTASSGATSYKIYRSPTNSGFTTSIGTSTNTTYSDLTVTHDNTYYYSVSAVNSTGEGPLSSSASAATQNAPTGGTGTPTPTPVVETPAEPATPATPATPAVPVTPVTPTTPAVPAAPAAPITPAVPITIPAPVSPVVIIKFQKFLTLGSQGSEVRALQTLLKQLGYYTHPSITGYFGAVTKKAVVDFQKANNLKPYPGYVGPGTRAVLNKLAQ